MYEEIVSGITAIGMAWASLEIPMYLAKHESYSNLKSIKEVEITDHKFYSSQELAPERYMKDARSYLNPETIDDAFLWSLFVLTNNLPVNRYADFYLKKFLKTKTFKGKPAIDYMSRALNKIE